MYFRQVITNPEVCIEDMIIVELQAELRCYPKLLATKIK